MQFVVHFERSTRDGELAEGIAFQASQRTPRPEALPAFYHAPAYIDVVVEAEDRRAAVRAAHQALYVELQRRAEARGAAERIRAAALAAEAAANDTIPAPPPPLDAEGAKLALAQVIRSLDEVRVGLESMIADAVDAGLHGFVEQLRILDAAAYEQAAVLRQIVKRAPVVELEIETTGDGAERLREAFESGKLVEIAGYPIVGVVGVSPKPSDDGLF